MTAEVSKNGAPKPVSASASDTSASLVRRATMIGLFAPICWGMSVSLVPALPKDSGSPRDSVFFTASRPSSSSFS